MRIQLKGSSIFTPSLTYGHLSWTYRISIIRTKISCSQAIFICKFQIINISCLPEHKFKSTRNELILKNLHEYGI